MRQSTGGANTCHAKEETKWQMEMTARWQTGWIKSNKVGSDVLPVAYDAIFGKRSFYDSNGKMFGTGHVYACR